MSEEEGKICRKCKTEKPIDEFGILNSSENGRNPVCFECRRKTDQASRLRTDKGKIQDQRGRGRPRKVISPPKETIVKPKETAEAQFIAAFKKTTIKSFLNDDLIPMLEKIANECCQKT